MKQLGFHRRVFFVGGVLGLLLILFVYVGVRSGPLAPVEVTSTTVKSQKISPAIFGIGIVEARYTYKIGPTSSGRIKTLDVHVGDFVKAGQIVSEMDPIDLDDKIRALDAARKKAEALRNEAEVRRAYAQTQEQRYMKLAASRATSDETYVTKKQELQIAEAAFVAANEELGRTHAEHDALLAQRNNLKLVSPADGIVALRDADPGTTIVAGQPIIEIIDPQTLWINTRLDQTNTQNLTEGLPADIVLRSRKERPLKGRVYRVEPKADSVTEETIAKIVFQEIPSPLPPIGELAEITIQLPALDSLPVIPNAAIHRDEGKTGVWKLQQGRLSFAVVKLGESDLDGNVQVKEGIKEGEEIVVYSENPLSQHHSIRIVQEIPTVRK